MLFSTNFPMSNHHHVRLFTLDWPYSSFIKQRKSQDKRVRVGTICSGNQTVHQWLLIPKKKWQTIARFWLTSFFPRGWWMQTITKRNQLTFPQGEMSLKELVRIIVISISIYLYLYLYNKLFRSQIEFWFKKLNPPFIWKGNWYDVGTGEENHRTTVQTFVFFLISYKEILD